jgi:hypothetical protein
LNSIIPDLKGTETEYETIVSLAASSPRQEGDASVFAGEEYDFIRSV